MRHAGLAACAVPAAGNRQQHACGADGARGVGAPALAANRRQVGASIGVGHVVLGPFASGSAHVHGDNSGSTASWREQQHASSRPAAPAADMQHLGPGMCISRRTQQPFIPRKGVSKPRPHIRAPGCETTSWMPQGGVLLLSWRHRSPIMET